MKQVLDFNARIFDFQSRLGSEVVYPSVDAALDVALRTVTKLGLDYRDRLV